MGHKIEFEYKGKAESRVAPAKWDEMSRKQLLSWCNVLRMELNRKEALSMAVLLMYNIPRSVFKVFSPVQDVQLRQTMVWLTNNNLTKNILGNVSILFRKYHGPANRLSNLTIGEYRRTELFYDMYRINGEKKFLYLLAATLFRPAGGGSGNDIRCRLTERGIIRRAKFFSWALHPTALMAIKIFYEGCRDAIMESHKVVYQRASKEPKLLQRRAPAFQDLEDHILAYSGGKLGNFNETQETNLYIFLKNMTQRIEEYERSTRK